MGWTFYREDGSIKVADGFDDIDGGVPNSVYGGTTAIDGGSV